MASAAIDDEEFEAFIGACTDSTLDMAEREYADMLKELQALDGAERRLTLADWARSRLWFSWGMFLDEWQGALHREAWRYHRADLDKPSPGKAWDDADPLAGRATIVRLLGADGFKHQFYATFPFRYLRTQEDEPWIAGAVGCTPLASFAEGSRSLDWTHLDIRHVVLWNPKSGACQVLGEAPGVDMVIMPEPCPDRLRVFADAGAWFSAWARQRAGFCQMRAHGLTESADGHVPGALIVGDHRRVVWPVHAAGELEAADGISAAELRAIVFRSANLPKVLEGAS